MDIYCQSKLKSDEWRHFVTMPSHVIYKKGIFLGNAVLGTAGRDHSHASQSITCNGRSVCVGLGKKHQFNVIDGWDYNGLIENLLEPFGYLLWR